MLGQISNFRLKYSWLFNWLPLCITDKLLNSSGRELRRALFSLKQLFQVGIVYRLLVVLCALVHHFGDRCILCTWFVMLILDVECLSVCQFIRLCELGLNSSLWNHSFIHWQKCKQSLVREPRKSNLCNKWHCFSVILGWSLMQAKILLVLYWALPEMIHLD